MRSHQADDEAELVFVGFAGFLDPPKATASRAIAALVDSGVAVKIVTGDNELVTQYICAKLDIGVTGVLTGADIAQLDDHALQAQVDRANLFCRVNPTQKNRIILALKRASARRRLPRRRHQRCTRAAFGRREPFGQYRR